MQTHEQTNIAPRKVSTALTLSLIMSGLGHLYCGRLIAGLAWAAAAAVTVPFVFVAILASSQWLALTVAIAAVVWAAAAVHAAIIAHRLGATYRLREYNRGIVYGLLLVIGSVGSLSYALLVRAQYAEAFVMVGQSMAPTLLQGDRILAMKTIYQLEPVARGDVLVFKNPEQPAQRWVKRVVGLPGDEVAIDDGVVSVNGEQVTHPAGDPAFAAVDMDAVTVPPHHVFVLGDNLPGSRDSRHIGPVPLVAVVGRVEMVYWPAGEWQRFGRPE